MIRFACPACDKALKVPVGWADEVADCPGCGQRVRVPAPTGRPPIQEVRINVDRYLEAIGFHLFWHLIGAFVILILVAGAIVVWQLLDPAETTREYQHLPAMPPAPMKAEDR